MRLIDADKLIEKLSTNLDNPEELPVISIGTVMRMIDGEEEIHTSQPEIIYCKDCRWNDGTCYCEFHYRDVKANDYCSWSERRIDEC